MNLTDVSFKIYHCHFQFAFHFASSFLSASLQRQSCLTILSSFFSVLSIGLGSYPPPIGDICGCAIPGIPPIADIPFIAFMSGSSLLCAARRRISLFRPLSPKKEMKYHDSDDTYEQSKGCSITSR